jgi:hypothetical protein
MFFSGSSNAFLGEIKQMTPADWKDLDAAVLRELINFRVEGLEICRALVNTLESLTEHVHIVYEVDRLGSGTIKF